MEKSKQSKKLSDNIREWHFSVADNDLVLFEEYTSTIARSKKTEEKDVGYKDQDELDDIPIKLREMAMYASHIGPVMVPELSDPTKHFKLWTLYSKVPLSPKILKKIEDAVGVESLEVLTRYRARVGIGLMFADQPTLKYIRKIIEESINNSIRI